MRDYATFVWSNRQLLAFGMVMCFASGFGQTFYISLFSSEIKLEYGLSDGEFGAVYSAGTLMSAAVLLWTGPLIDRLDLRLYVVMIFSGLATAAIIMWGSTHIAGLFMCIFLLRQCGQGLPGHAAMTSMARYFEQGRGKALSIAGLGWPLGEAVLPILTVAMVLAVGWRETWLAIAGSLLVVIIPVVLTLLRGHSNRHAAYLKNLEQEEREAEAAESKNAGSGSGPQLSWRRAQVIRDPRFYLILPGLMGPSFIFTGLFFHQILIMLEIQGWSRPLLASSYTLFAVMTVVASLITGILVDRAGAVRLLPWFLIPQILAILILLSGNEPWLIWLYMGTTGISVGVTHTLIAALWPELYGRRYLGSIRSLTIAISVFFSAASPVLLGYLFDFGAGLTSIGFGLIAYAAIGAGLCTIASRMPARHPPISTNT